MNVHPEPEAEDDFDSAPNRLGRALGLGLIVTLLALCAFFGFLFFSQPAARAGEYGEYPGQGRDPHWASKAFGDSGVRIRGKPQYEPYSSYQSDSPSYGHHHHGDRYSRGNHRIKTAPHSHPHHRERGYSSVVHTHAVTHKHVYRPRYTHPRYTHHYRRWRPEYRYEYRPWQERAYRRYVTIRVPLDRYGQIIPGHGYRADDYRDPRERQYFESRRAYWSDRYGQGYRDDPRDRRYPGQRDCKAPVTHYGETRATKTEAIKTLRVGWSGAVVMLHGSRYATIDNAIKPWIEECVRHEFKEEGAQQLADKAVSWATFGKMHLWKWKCQIIAAPCAGSMVRVNLGQNRETREPDHEEPPEDPHNDHDDEGPGPGPTK
jgi:hypothetical protein